MPELVWLCDSESRDSVVGMDRPNPLSRIFGLVFPPPASAVIGAKIKDKVIATVIVAFFISISPKNEIFHGLKRLSSLVKLRQKSVSMCIRVHIAWYTVIYAQTTQ